MAAADHEEMEELLARRLGRRLRQLREKRQISQTLLADRCGMSRSYISAIENGRVVVSVAVIDKICLVLGISLGQFFERLDG